MHNLARMRLLVATTVAGIGATACVLTEEEATGEPEVEEGCAGKCDFLELSELGFRFEETLDGTFSPRAGGAPTTAVLDARMTFENFDEFIANPDHRGTLSGRLTFEEFLGERDVVVEAEEGSHFDFLRLNPDTQAHEFVYRVRFRHRDTAFVMNGTKFMQRDGDENVLRELLEDFTTMIGEVVEEDTGESVGDIELIFRTFESKEAVLSAASFFLSFTVTRPDGRRANPISSIVIVTRFNRFVADILLPEYFGF